MSQRPTVQTSIGERADTVRRAVEKWISGIPLSEVEADLVEWAKCSSLVRALEFPA